jgi:hypothetical protein
MKTASVSSLATRRSTIVSGRPRKMDNRPRAAVTWRARSSSDSIMNWNAFELKYRFRAPCLGSKTNNGTTVLEALDASISPVLSFMRKSLRNKKMDLPYSVTSHPPDCPTSVVVGANKPLNPRPRRGSACETLCATLASFWLAYSLCRQVTINNNCVYGVAIRVFYLL